MAESGEEALRGFFAALAGKDFEAWKQRLAPQLREELEQELASEEEQQAFLEDRSSEAPDRFEVLKEEVSEEDGHLEVLIETVTDSGPGSEEERERLIVAMVQEDGDWKVLDMLPAAGEGPPEPQEIRRTDAPRGEVDDYDLERYVSLGGPILHVSHEEEYGLVVIRVMDTEQNVYIPTLGRLQELGFDAGTLVPDAIVEVEGHPHRTDDLKTLATDLKMG
jgi:hypothetical protein